MAGNLPNIRSYTVYTQYLWQDNDQTYGAHVQFWPTLKMCICKVAGKAFPFTLLVVHSAGEFVVSGPNLIME